MTYATPAALRIALEQRLLKQSLKSGINLDRLRRRVIFERVTSRLAVADPDSWVLKGGMAMEVRLRDAARLTKDIDLGLRDPVDDGSQLHERLVAALTADPFTDGFVLTAEPVSRLLEDDAGHVTWRSRLSASLAGRPFGRVQLDVSPRAHELTQTDRLMLPNSLDFAEIATSAIEVIDIQRHAAEKFHGMGRTHPNRENTRVRDLVDLVLMHDFLLLDAPRLGQALTAVWQEREGLLPPPSIAQLPQSWTERYEQLAAEHQLSAPSLAYAEVVVSAIWEQAITAG